jgi:hypothetical protein
MSEITSTNIRVGPGVYLALRDISEKTGMGIGTWANLLLVGSLLSGGSDLSSFRPEIRTAVAADALAAIGELFKTASLEQVKNTSLAQLYQKLLNAPSDK